MYTTTTTTTVLTFLALLIASIHACNPQTPGCDHPGNFTGTLTPFTNPKTAHCGAGNQTSIFANIPSTFYNPPDESPCNTPINVTNPTTLKTITAIVIGNCTACKNDNIQLTEAGLAALSPNGRLIRAPKTVKWTFDTEVEEEGEEESETRKRV